jgi:hypothetical protein
MLTKEQEPSEPSGIPTKHETSVFGAGSTALFVLVLLLLFVSETLVIHGLWFNPTPSLSYAKRFIIPLYVLFPGFLGLGLLREIGRMSKAGQISLIAAGKFRISLGLVLMMSYMSILDLANIAF